MLRKYKCSTCGVIFDENRLGKMIFSGYNCPFCEVGIVKEEAKK